MNLDEERLGETGLQVAMGKGIPQVVGGGVAFTFTVCKYHGAKSGAAGGGELVFGAGVVVSV